jgi:predicted phosphodiesterase
MRIALLADIHSNLLALEAVVKDLQVQAPDAIYLLGDQVNRCPWPNEVMDLIAAEGWPAIQGNHDLVVKQIHTPENSPPFTDRKRYPCLWWTNEVLAPAHMATLRAWPAEFVFSVDGAPPLRFFHGVPTNPFLGIFEGMPAATVEKILNGVCEPVVVCGHTHRPMAHKVGHWTIYNPGSVGMPYNEDPRAQYMILDLVSTHGKFSWQPHFRRIEYELAALEPAFVRSGLLASAGPLGELLLLTALTGHAYISDYGFWLRQQPADLANDPARAVGVYLAKHGPGRWAFSL